MPAFEWNEAKAATNLVKHRIGFAAGRAIWADPHRLLLPSFRETDGEPRYKMIGLIDERLYTAVFVERGSTIRLISVRRSHVSEGRSYASQDDV